MNLSFCGCGFLCIYQVGVAMCFKKYAPHLLVDKISGASAGAITACFLLCDIPLGEITSTLLYTAQKIRKYRLGAFNPLFKINKAVCEGLEKYLPEDAHTRVNGKLYISLTRLYDRKNVVVSHFNSREELIQALCASAFIPFFSGLIPPRFHGIRYIDGCFSNNLPILDENTITVSPFCGESDICPRDMSSQLFHITVANTTVELSKQNIYRSSKILYPPNPKFLSNMCKQGFDDALRYLHQNNLINCTRCLAVQSTFVILETLEESIEYDPECSECKMHKQIGLLSEPLLVDFLTFLTALNEAKDSTNKGFINRFFKHKSVKLLSLLNLPYTVPVNIVYATFTNLIGNRIETYNMEYKVIGNVLCTRQCTLKCAKHFKFTRLILNVLKLQSNLVEWSRYFLEQLNYIFPQIKSIYYLSTFEKIKCQLAISEYGSNIYNKIVDNNAPICKNLNLMLQNNKLQLWNECNNETDCVISVSDIETENDTFKNILQVTKDQKAVIAYYYMDENDKVQVTEIFDVTDTDSHGILSNDEVETNGNLQFDEWDDPTWISQHTLNDVTSSTENNQQSLENLIDISLDEDNLINSNIFSDPESEWEMEINKEEKQQSYNHPDNRPEVDQPSLSMED